ncbi:MAG: hypothetical protein C0403_05330, partial [Desulfobacterium sp.]|nr:hypothetical protein [Desulfobacterium sp.]
SRLLDKLEDGIIDDDDFRPRYEELKNNILILENEKERIQLAFDSKHSLVDSMNASFEEISSFGKNWGYLDDIGKAIRINSIVKEIRATKENVDIDIYIDVVKVSHTDRDSSPQSA